MPRGHDMSKAHKGVSFDPRTVALMTEFFGPHVCVECRRPAERWVKRKFLCHACARTSKDREQEAVVIHETRDNRPNGSKQRQRVTSVLGLL